MAISSPLVEFKEAYFVAIADEPRTYTDDDGNEETATDRDTGKPLIQVSISVAEDAYGMKAVNGGIISIPLDEKELKALQQLPAFTPVRLVDATVSVYTNRNSGKSTLSVRARGIEPVRAAGSVPAQGQRAQG